MKKIFVFLFAVMLMLPASVFAQFYGEAMLDVDARLYQDTWDYISGSENIFYDDMGKDVIIDFGLRNWQRFAYDSTPRELPGIPAINFYVQFPVTDMVTLAFFGYFYNITTGSARIDYETNITQTNDKKAKMTKNDWDDLKNELDIFIGLTPVENLMMAIFVGGGCNYSQYTTTEKTADYDAADSLSSYQEEKTGYGFGRFGVGFLLDGPMFNDKITYLNINADLIIGAGDDGTLVNKSDNKLAGKQITSTYAYLKSNIWVEAPVSLKSIPGLENFKRFNLRPAVLAIIAGNVWTNGKTIDDIDVSDTYTVKNKPMDYDFFIRPSLELDLQGNSNHRFRLRYGLGIFVNGGTSSTDTTTAGTTVKGKETVNTNVTIRVGDVRARYRIIFPKFVYLETEARYRVDQDLVYTKTTVKEASPGFEVGDVITDTVTQRVRHRVTPKIKLGIDFDVCSLTFGWKPDITISQDSNILNWANWDVAFVLQFDPKSL